MKKVSVDLFRAAPYMLMLVLLKDALFHCHMLIVQATGIAIWWLTEPHYVEFCTFSLSLLPIQNFSAKFWRNDGNSSPKYKLLCFITTNFFAKRRRMH
jgi:hypothetical protein